MTGAARYRNRIWHPLDADASVIRILGLHKVEFAGQPLRATLEVWSLDRYPRYDAISWAWGRSGPMALIVINSIEWLIPAKLDACLRRLATVSRERTFWVDAVCVDQSNQTERAQQVRMMEQIFSHGNTVCVWLGSGQDTERPTGIRDDLSKRLVRDDQSGSSQFYVSSKYFDEEWWHRVWPMQEIILARNLKLIDDKEVTDFELLRDIAEGLQRDVVRESIPPVPQVTGLLWLADFRARTHLTQVDTCAQLTELLYHSRIRSTADPRDRVYGLLGVCTFLFGKDFLQPDYNRPIADVYHQLACRLVEKTHSLAFLNQVIPLHHTDTTIPSWVPDLGSRYDHKAEVVRLHDRNCYKASNYLGPKHKLSHSVSTSTGIFSCTGVLFDRIRVVFGLCEHKPRLSEQEELCWYNVTMLQWFAQYTREADRDPRLRANQWVFNDSPDFLPHQLGDANGHFAVTIMRGLDDGGARLESPLQAWKQFATLWLIDAILCSELEVYSTFKDMLDTRDELVHEQLFGILEAVGAQPWGVVQAFESNSGSVLGVTEKAVKARPSPLRPRSEVEKAIRGAVDRCYKNLAGTRFFIADDGFIGLGPADTQVGDKLAILAGGNVPYVLRKASGPYTTLYHYVGESYVHGAMQGEIGRNGEQLSTIELA